MRRLRKRADFQLISAMRNSVFMKVFSVFIATSILLFSCSEKYPYLPESPNANEPNSTARYISIHPPANSTDGATLSEFGAYIKRIGEFSLNENFSKQRIVNYINTLSTEFGYTQTVDIAFFDEVMNSEFFLTTSPSMHLFFLVLREKGKISVREFELLDNLDNAVVTAGDDNVMIKSLLTNFEENISTDNQLTSHEKDRMLTVIKLLSGVMEPYLTTGGELEERGWTECINCIIKNKWKIGIWTVIGLVISVAGCAYLQAQTGFPFALCVQAVWLAFAGSISRYCWRECFSEPEPVCQNPVCPTDFNNFFDNGFTCCTDDLPGASIVTGQNNAKFLSVLPNSTGGCLPGWTFVQFTQTCMKQMEVGWENLRVVDNKRFCVDANNCG